MNKEEILAEDKRVVDEFKSNPENRKRATELAFSIQNELKGWFTVADVLKIFNINQEEAAKQLEMLLIMNICVAKVKKSVPYFKIDLDNRTQRQLLLDEIAVKEGEIAFLKEKLVKLD